jgi:hypothetical protein
VGYDAIVVLGGGLREGGELPSYARRRFDLALERNSGEPFLALSAGTTHLAPILDAAGRVETESRAGALYLIQHGVPADRILCESTSYDTIGNAYFSRVQLVQPLGWTRLLVITSNFHRARAEMVFRWVYGLDKAGFDLDFAGAPDEGLSPQALAARQARERDRVARVEELRGKLTSLCTLARWLFTEHQAYQAVREPLSADSADLLESY